jgi:hypothetical protein
VAHDVIHHSLREFVQGREGESADIIRNVCVLLNHPICWLGHFLFIISASCPGSRRVRRGPGAAPADSDSGTPMMSIEILPSPRKLVVYRSWDSGSGSVGPICWEKNSRASRNIAHIK